MKNHKYDNREPRGGWAPGGYTCICRSCGDQFIGAKRCITCADCAYKPQGEAVCKGDLTLGTGCGKCKRCNEQLANDHGINLDTVPPVQQVDQWDEALRGKKMSSHSGKVIFKYQMPVKERFTMRLPQGAQILRVADQDGMFWLWAVVDTRVPDEDRHFVAVKCGANVPEDRALNYIGMCAIFVQQELALYIFEDKTK